MKRMMKIYFTALAICCATAANLFAGPFDFIKDIAANEDKFEKIMNTSNKTFDVIDSFDRATEPITPKDAYTIGRTVAASLLATYPLYKSTMATGYANKICRAIAMNSPVPVIYKQYCVGILDSDEINALSTSSGIILISRGLLASAESEDEIAAVIAHEMAHIQLEHSINVIKANRKKDLAVSSVSLADDVVGNYSDMSGKDRALFHDFALANNIAVSTLTQTGYPKEQEFKADAEALKLMESAGYDPSAMESMLKKLDAGYKDRAGQGGWTKTHPKPADRLAKVKKLCASMKYKGADPSVRSNRYKSYMKDFKK